MGFLFVSSSGAPLSPVLLMCASDAGTRKGSLRREHPLSSPHHLDQRTSAPQPGSVTQSKSFRGSSHYGALCFVGDLRWVGATADVNQPREKVSKFSRNGQRAQSSDRFTNIHRATRPFNQPTLFRAF